MQDQTILPGLNYYCRNARLCLKKATFSRKSQHHHDELSRLREFESLVGTVIPAHPAFEEKKTDKQIVELQLCLTDARRRIQELESEPATSSRVHSPSARSTAKASRSDKKSKTATRSLGPGSSEIADVQVEKSHKKGKSTSKRSDSPKKQQSWGIWTANPNPPDALPPPQPRSISPPPKYTAHSKKFGALLAGDFPAATREAFSSFISRSNSPDQRAEAILGGCALLASQLTSFEDGKASPEPQAMAPGPDFEANSSPLKRDEAKYAYKRSKDWLADYTKSQERTDFNAKDEEVKLPGTSPVGGQRFRFASDYFEKRLQESLNYIKHGSPDLEEDRFGSSPVKTMVPLRRKQKEAFQLDQLSSEESLLDPLNSSASAGTLKTRLDTGQETSTAAEKSRRIPRKYVNPVTGEGGEPAIAGNLRARNVLPAVEQRLSGEMLCSQGSPPKVSTSGSSRKKHKKRGVIGLIDDAIRQNVDSDHSGAPDDAARLLPHSLCNNHDNLHDSSPSCSHVSSKEKSYSEKIDDQQGAIQGVQAEALEGKMSDLQSLVGILKGSVEEFASRVEQEGDKWGYKMQRLEKQWQVWRDDTEKEFLGMKGSVQEEVQAKLDELRRGLGKTERLLTEAELKPENSEQMETRLEECFRRVDSMKRQVDSLASDVKIAVVREVNDRLSQSVQDINHGRKSEMDELEVGMSKDLENMRKEIENKLETFREESERFRRAERHHIEALVEGILEKRKSPQAETSFGAEREKLCGEIKYELWAEGEQLRRSERRQIEALIDEKIERRLSQRMETVSEGKEKIMADMKNELRLLWAEVDLLSKGRETIKENMEHLTQIAEKAKETISKEQVILKSESGSLRKQLQYFKKESMQIKVDAEDFKKDIELEMDEMRCTVGRLNSEGESIRASISHLKKVGDDLRNENKSLRKLVDRVQEEEAARKVESEALKIVKGSSKVEGSGEKMIMERIEKLSQLYLGGLEEVRGDVINTKLDCEDRLAELESCWKELRKQQEANAASESSLRELVLDGLETRISHLESELQRKVDFEQERQKVESALATVEKEKDQVANALAQVIAAANKADELVSEMQGTFKLEVANIQRHSLMMQESLASEKEAVSTAASEVARIREQVGQEKELAIANIHRQSMMMQESLDSEKEAAALEVARIHEHLGRQREAAALEIARIFGKEKDLAIDKIKRHSLIVQESLASETEAAASELARIHEQLGKEKELALANIQRHSMMLRESLDSETAAAAAALGKEKEVSLANLQRHSVMLQESLDSEKTAAAAAATEMARIRDQIGKEKETTIANIKRHSIMVQESLDSEKAVVAAAAAEVARICDQIGEEKEMAIASIKRHSIMMQESLDSEKEAAQAAAMEVREHIGKEKDAAIANIKRQSIMVQETLDFEKEAAQAAAMEVARIRDHIGKEKETVIADIKRHSITVQETLASEKEAAASEVARIRQYVGKEKEIALAIMSEAREKTLELRDHIGKEKESALAIMSEAKLKSKEIQEGLERERSGLRRSIMMAEKERETAAAAAAEAMAAAAKAGEVLDEIFGVQRKSVSISNDVATALHKDYTKELEGQLEGWRRSMTDEFAKARSYVQGIEEEKRRVVEGIEEEKRKLSIFIPQTSVPEDEPVSQEEFERHVETTEEAIADLRKRVKDLNSSLDGISYRQAQSEQQDELVKKEINTLKVKLGETASEIKSVHQHNNVDVSRRLQETAEEQSIILEKVSECSKKMKMVESVQIDLVGTIEEIKVSTSAWMEKYDAAARVLQEIEKRIAVLETASTDSLENVEKGPLQPAQKEKLLKLYKELSTFIKRMTNHEEHEAEGISDDAEANSTRFMTLETRLDNLEAQVLRTLDGKVQELSAGMQTALDGASMAESKCSALGAELVKLFRLIAMSRKDSPTKGMMPDAADDSDEQNHCRSHKSPGQNKPDKSKTLSSHAACAYCKRAASKGSADIEETSELRLQDLGPCQSGTPDCFIPEGHKSGHHYEAADDSKSPGIHRNTKDCAVHGRQPLDMQTHQGSPSKVHRARDVSPIEKLRTRHGEHAEKQQKDDLQRAEDISDLQNLAKRNVTDLKIIEGKLPITQERSNDKRLECAKKDGIHLSSGKSCQSTNIRLESGKFQLNVSHRSALVSSARTAKRGDVISVHP